MDEIILKPDLLTTLRRRNIGGMAAGLRYGCLVNRLAVVNVKVVWVKPTDI